MSDVKTSDNQLAKLGPFILTDPIAEGGMGQVWRGHHGATGFDVAVKVLTGRMTQRPRFRQTFRNEARSMSRLDHPNIVKVYDFGEIKPGTRGEQLFGPRSPYLVMEFVDATPTGPEQITDWGTLQAVLIELLEGLAHAHARGVIHRDLKPSNVLLTDRKHVKISDFGIAFGTTDTGVDVERLRAAGTPEFMAPEQCHGQWRDFGPWTDLYGVGCLAFTLISGEPPFLEDHPMGTMLAKLEQDPPPLRQRFAVPEGLDRWIRRLLRRTPRHRFQRAADAIWTLKGLALPQIYSIIDTDQELQRPLESDTLMHAQQDTMITGGFDTLAGKETTATHDLEPNFEGVSTVNLRSSRAPVPVDWRAGRRYETPNFPDSGLELFSLRRSRVVGRESIRDMLWEKLRTVQTTATPQAVILRGPEGVGKRRIAEWLCTRAHEVGAATVLHAHHSADGGPADGLAPMVMRHLRCTGLPRADVQSRLLKLLHTDGTDLDEASALGEYLLPPAIDEHQESASTIRLFSLVERNLVLARHLEKIALERTVILRLDDAQWGHESLDFVHWLLSRNRCAFLVIMTVSEEVLSERVVESMVLDDLVELDTVQMCEVPALNAETHADLLKSMVCLEPGLAHMVEARTAGNPMFTIQLIQSWVDQGALTPGPAGYTLARGVSKALPKSLSEVWAGRIKLMLQGRSKQDIAALELAAVMGQEIDREEWLTACRLAGVSPSNELTQDLIRDHFIKPIDERDADAGWLFIHAMLREALEHHARENDRYRSHHRHCVALLRSQGLYGSRLARHLREAGDLHGSLEPIRTSVEQLLDAGDDRASAAALLEWRDTLRAMGVPENSPAWIEPAIADCYVAILRGELDLAARIAAAQAEKARSELLNGVLCQCLTIQAQIAVDRGRYDEALETLAAAIDAYDDLTRADLWARCQLQLASAHRALANYDEAVAAYHEAETAFLSIDEVVRAAHCMLGRAHIARRRRDAQTAARLIDEARIELTKAGARAGVAASLHARAEVHRMNGDLDAAEESYREARERYTHIGSPKSVWVELDLATVLIMRKNFLEADLLLQRALTAARRQGRRILELKARANLVVCAAHGRDWHAWDGHMQQIEMIVADTRAADIDVAHHIAQSAHLAKDAGQWERAVSGLLLAQVQWRAMGREDQVAAVDAHLSEVKKLSTSWN